MMRNLNRGNVVFASLLAVAGVAFVARLAASSPAAAVDLPAPAHDERVNAKTETAVFAGG